MTLNQGGTDPIATLAPEERLSSPVGASSPDAGAIDLLSTHRLFAVADSTTSSLTELYGRTDPTTGDFRISEFDSNPAVPPPPLFSPIVDEASTAADDYLLHSQLSGCAKSDFTRTMLLAGDESIDHPRPRWLARLAKRAMTPLVTFSLVLAAAQPSTADPFFSITSLRGRRRSSHSDPTSITAPTVSIEEETFRCFRGLDDEDFRDGMADILGDRIQRLISMHGSAAIDALSALIFSGCIAEEARTHALRWLARIDSPVTARSRLWLLRFSLLSPCPMVRDGALLGLAIMRNPLPIHDLRSAMERESLPGLKGDMLRVLERLERLQ